MSPVKVISQQPPGGRCGLYTRYAQAIEALTGWPHSVVHTETRDAHGEGFPSLVIRGASLQPEDAFILTPEEICSHLAGLDLEPAAIDALMARLRTIHDDFMKPLAG
jgi:cystathionine gamma-synthase